MKCPTCGAGNPEGALTCSRCTGLLKTVAGHLDDTVDLRREQLHMGTGNRPVDIDLTRPIPAPATRPQLLVDRVPHPGTPRHTPTPRTGGAPGTAGRIHHGVAPAPVNLPSLDARPIPSQPPLPVSAPRVSDDEPHIAVQFESTMVGPAPVPQDQLRALAAGSFGPGPSTAVIPEMANTVPRPGRVSLIDAALDSTLVDAEPPPDMYHDTDPEQRPGIDDGYDIAPPSTDPDLTLPDGFLQGDGVPEPGALEIAGEDTWAINRHVHLASFTRRMTAGMIDLLAVGILTAVYIFVAVEQLPTNAPRARGTGFDLLIDAALIHAEVVLPAAVVFLGLFVVYEVVLVALIGQTVGHLAMGIQVISTRTLSPGLGTAIVRAITTVLGLLLLGLGWTSMLLDRRRRGLHDRFAGTLVGTHVDRERRGQAV